MPPYDICSKKFLLQLIEGEKDVYFVSEITMARTLSTPEFEKAHLWSLVKDNADFRRFMPESVYAKPRRLNKEWLWRVIVRFAPTWANNYTRMVQLQLAKKRSLKKPATATISAKNKELFESLNINPGPRFMIKAKDKKATKPREKKQAENFNFVFGKEEDDS